MVTISALLAMAAHMMQKGVTSLDIAGLAQKNGAVHSHIRICDDPDKLHAVRIATGGADLLLGCDILTSGGYETLSKLQTKKTHAVVNSEQSMTAEFTRNPDLDFPEQKLRKSISLVVDGQVADRSGSFAEYVEATALARNLMGDTIGANLFLVGYALQKGYLPLSVEALNAAIDLNGTAPEFNKQALLWGRRMAHDRDAVTALLRKSTNHNQTESSNISLSFENYLERRTTEITAYQDKTYAKIYIDTVKKVAEAENMLVPGSSTLREAAAEALFKVMAIKDEYEVARLYTDGRFEQSIKEEFSEGAHLTFHLAPPLLAKRDEVTGHLRKKEYGPWIFKFLKILAAQKYLRTTPFDIFGWTEERKIERMHRDTYIMTLQQIINGLNINNYDIAVEIARLPLSVRGFGHVWANNYQISETRRQELLVSFRKLERAQVAAE